MSTTLKTTIKLRKDTLGNYNLVADRLVPLNGEVCLVETNAGLRAKVGDGVTNFASLPFTDSDNLAKASVVQGYLHEGSFYEDTEHTKLITGYNNQLYVDSVSAGLYFYDGSKYTQSTVTLPVATEATMGITRLYTTNGSNTDGTMTQKAITDAINGIKFGVDTSDSECLVLDKPW